MLPTIPPTDKLPVMRASASLTPDSTIKDLAEKALITNIGSVDADAADGVALAVICAPKIFGGGADGSVVVFLAGRGIPRSGVSESDVLRLAEGAILGVIIIAVIHEFGQVAQVVLVFDLVNFFTELGEDVEIRNIGIGDDKLGEVSIAGGSITDRAALEAYLVGGGRATTVKGSDGAVVSRHTDLRDVSAGEVPFELELWLCGAKEIAAVDARHRTTLPVESKDEAIGQMERGLGVVGFLLMFDGCRLVEGRAAAVS